MARDFPSKRDGWLVAVIWLAGALLVGTAWLPLGADDLGWSQLLLVLLQLGAAAFMFWVLYGTGYRIEERDLSVRGGPFRWRIPLDAIVSVTPTRNPLSSPACSLDRLRVVHRATAWRARADDLTRRQGRVPRRSRAALPAARAHH